MNDFSNVRSLPATTTYTPEQALLAAMEFTRTDKLKQVLIVGVDTEGMLVIRSSRMTCEYANWLLDKAKMYSLMERP